jgi:hypothetical protein
MKKENIQTPADFEEYYGSLPSVETKWKKVDIVKEEFDIMDLMGATVVYHGNTSEDKSIGMVGTHEREMVIVWKDNCEDTIIDSDHGRQVLKESRIFPI